MEEVLNKDVFIAVFIVLLIIAILINLLLLALLLLPPLTSRDVIWPFNKLMTSFALRHSRPAGRCVTPKHWLAGLCGLCHLFTACLHHALVAHLYRSRDGYLPPPAPCPTLVLTEVSAFLFPTLSRLLVAVLVVTEALHMTSVSDVRRVTCALMTVAGIYVSGVLLPVFFFLYLDSASEPCYAGRSILRYTPNSSKGRVLPVLSYILPVVFIVVAVVVMIVIYNLKKTSASSGKSSATSHNFVALNIGIGDLGDDECGAGRRRYNNGQTDVRTVSLDLQVEKSAESGMKSRRDCHSKETKLVSFPWDTLVVCVLVVMLEFVFCVRQFAYWSQVDDRLMSTSQWIQLWAADRVLSLLSLILVPCCWLFDSYIRQVFHCQSKGSGSRQLENTWGKEQDSRHPETYIGRIYQNTFNGSEIENGNNDTGSFDNIGRDSYRKALSKADDRTAHSSSVESSNEVNEDTFLDHRKPSHGTTTNRERACKISDGSQQEWRRQGYKAYSDQGGDNAEDNPIIWGMRGQRYRSADDRTQKALDISTSPGGREPQSNASHLDFSKGQYLLDSNRDYLSDFISRDEPNQTFPPKSRPPAHHTDKTKPENRSLTEKQYEHSNNHVKGSTAVSSLQRNGVSAPNVLYSSVTNHEDGFNRNRSYPNMTGERSTGQMTKNDFPKSDARYVRDWSNQHCQAEWTGTTKSLSHGTEQQTSPNSGWTTTEDTFRHRDKDILHNGQLRREDHRTQQKYKDEFFPDDRRRHQTFEDPSRQRFPVHEERTKDFPPPQQTNHVAYSQTIPRGGKRIMYNTDYKPGDEIPHNQHHQKDKAHRDRESSRNDEGPIKPYPDHTEVDRRVTPFHQQSGFAQTRSAQSTPHNEDLGEPQGMKTPATEKPFAEREGGTKRNASQELPQRYRIPNSQEVLQRQKIRNNQDVTERAEPPRSQRITYQQGTTERTKESHEAPERDGRRHTENDTDIHMTRTRLNATETVGSPHGTTDQRRLPRQTAFVQHQGHPRSNNFHLDQPQDHTDYHRGARNEQEDRLGYKTFANHLNIEPSRYQSVSAGYQGQGQSGHRDIDNDLGHRDWGQRSGFLQEQGEGHFGYRGQGHREHIRLAREDENGGRLTFSSREQGRETNSYNPESLC